jgi:oxygen-dependent protoporphyrinogen oxidase
LQTLTEALAQALGENLWTQVRVHSLSHLSDFSFEIVFERNGDLATLQTRSLMLATPAFTAAQLLQPLAPELSAWLAEIPYTTIAAVPLAYRVSQVARPMDGFGFLAPRGQGLRTLGSIWNTSLFPQRAPDGFVLTNNFIGGETDRDAILLSDDELTRIVHRDLQTVLGITGEPHRLPITRWQRAIPQYNLGHAARVATIEALLQERPGLRLAGNYLHGIALGDLIRQGKELAAIIAKEGR